LWSTGVLGLERAANVKRKGLGQSGNEVEDEENYRVDEWG